MAVMISYSPVRLQLWEGYVTGFSNTRYKQKKTMMLTRWEKDLKMVENDVQKRGTAFLKEYRFYSLGHTQDFVHIR